LKEPEIIVSIIVPCYNYGRFVPEALTSIAAQTYTQWECIVVNDGSTDDSREVIEGFIAGDGRFRLLNIENSGVSVARNTGVAQARGIYIFPLDADNKIHPECIAKCVAAFQKRDDTRLVYTEAELFGDASGLWDLPDFEYKDLLKFNMVDNTSLFLKKDFDRIGGYRTNMVDGLEDWDFFIALLYGCVPEQVVKIRERLFYYRVRGKSRGSSLAVKSEFGLMVDNMVFNNFRIYQEYFPDIFNRIHAYDFHVTLLKKKPVKWMTGLLVALSKLKPKKN
jgi:glycosyltransferase involved in cell wall biosynthesis